MELVVEKPAKLADGRHEGQIIGVKYRHKPYEYTDLEIASEGIVLKAGYPTFLSEESKLGQLLKRFGFVIAEGLKVEVDEITGRGCEFVTTTSGKFANVIPDSVKPLMRAPNANSPKLPAAQG